MWVYRWKFKQQITWVYDNFYWRWFLNINFPKRLVLVESIQKATLKRVESVGKHYSLDNLNFDENVTFKSKCKWRSTNSVFCQFAPASKNTEKKYIKTHIYIFLTAKQRKSEINFCRKASNGYLWNTMEYLVSFGQNTPTFVLKTNMSWI